MEINWGRGVRALTCALLSASVQAAPSAWTDRDQIRASFERLADADLKALYLRCSDESERRVLAFEEAAHCSIGSEVLKLRAFGGSFEAMLAWWRQQRGGSPAGPGVAGR